MKQDHRIQLTFPVEHRFHSIAKTYAMKKIIINTSGLLREERKCLNAIILFLLICCSVSCKKKNDGPRNNNEVTATVVVSPSSTININATASKALMGCENFGGGTYVDGTNETNAAVYITVYNSNIECVTSPGSYGFSCEYRPNVADQNTPILSNNGVNPGSITFTKVNSNYMEGSFTAVCRNNAD